MRTTYDALTTIANRQADHVVRELLSDYVPNSRKIKNIERKDFPVGVLLLKSSEIDSVRLEKISNRHQSLHFYLFHGLKGGLVLEFYQP